MNLDDWEIRDWPKKFMVNRDFTLTCLLRANQQGRSPRMTPQEFEYIQRAMAVLEDPGTTLMAQHKILKTVGQIFDMNARRIEDRMIDRFDELMAR